MSAERLRINAEDLVDIPQDSLAMAFGKARRELDFIPGVAEIRRLALADEESKLDGETRAAWDIVTKHVQKWGRWNSERDSAYIEDGAPILPRRALDTVRRSGSWMAYLAMDADSFPFQQKRFFEEYKAWTSTELSLPMLAAQLQLPPKQVKTIKQLAKSMDMVPAAPTPRNSLREFTADEWATRRQELKQQAEEAKRRFGR